MCRAPTSTQFGHAYQHWFYNILRSRLIKRQVFKKYRFGIYKYISIHFNIYGYRTYGMIEIFRESGRHI
jgi:hypothetical protein